MRRLIVVLLLVSTTAAATTRRSRWQPALVGSSNTLRSVRRARGATDPPPPDVITPLCTLSALRGGASNADALKKVLQSEEIVSLTVSILVLVCVSWASSFDNHLAALIGSAPTGIPLTMFLVHAKNANAPRAASRALMLSLCQSLIKGVLSTLAFVLGALAAVGAGRSFGEVLFVGFCLWGATARLLTQYF